MTFQSLLIVLAEDDDGHATLIQRNLKRSGILNTIHRVHDGQEALDLLHGEGKYQGQSPPTRCLLLLDINMPRLNGIEVLRRLKADSRTDSIPVIMITTTDSPREVETCYRLGCGVYITKPVEPSLFTEAVQRLGLFLQIITLPHDKGGSSKQLEIVQPD